MKPSKLFLNFLVCLSLVLQSSWVQAVPFSTGALEELNYHSDLESMKLALFEYFPSPEDQKQIQHEFIKLKRITKNWVWRYEIKGDQVMMRVNGKVQYRFKFPETASSHIFVNGQKMSFKKGQSFQTFLNRFQEIIKNKEVVRFQDLFIEKAWGIPPLLAFGAFALMFGGFMLLSTQVKASGQGRYRCKYPKYPYRAVPPFTSRQSGLVAYNFKKMCGIRTRRCQSFETVDQCARKKSSRRSSAWGHALSFNRAKGICQSIYDQLQQCLNQSPSTPAASVPAGNDPLGSIVGKTCAKNSCAGMDRSCRRGNQACCSSFQGRCQSRPRAGQTNR